MYKIAGTVKYPFGIISPSDPSKTGMGYATKEAAQKAADAINRLLETYDDDDSCWNKEHWKTKPEPWIVFSVED